jgi:hypothetical protein
LLQACSNSGLWPPIVNSPARCSGSARHRRAFARQNAAMIARAGVVLSVLQFAFALTWIVYAAYLPALAAQAGIATSLVPWILLVDQAIFVVCDWLAGVLADRVGDAVARLGRQIAVVTVVSCAAFLALPLVAPGRSPVLLLALAVVWSASSSMLRAPPLVLLGRHAARPQQAWLAGLYALGLGAAGAVAPYTARQLATIDPRIPFAATSCIVAVITLLLAAMPRDAPGAPDRRPVPTGSLALFTIAIALLALGFQVHASIASAPIYLRHVARDELGNVLPVFWIGFNLATLPFAAIARRAGGPIVMLAGSVIGVAALSVVAIGDSLAIIIAAQAMAGLAWAGILVGAFAASTGLARKPGTVTGVIFSLLAAATVARIAFVASGAAAAPQLAGRVPWLAPIAWGAGTLVLASFALRRRPA